MTYEATIESLRRAVAATRAGRTERVQALRRWPDSARHGDDAAAHRGPAGRGQDHGDPQCLVDILQERRVPVRGFTTEEIREGGRRVRFAVTAVGGTRAVLAHVNLGGPPRVGRYGAELKAFERVALPALSDPAAGT